MTTYDKLRHIITQANPEIVELKFGCWIKDYMNGSGVIISVEKYENESDCYNIAFFQPDFRVLRQPYYGNWEIIGRPIRLSDILITIRCVIPRPVVSENSDKLAVVNRWNLLNDNLNHQSDETIDLLYKILK